MKNFCYSKFLRRSFIGSSLLSYSFLCKNRIFGRKLSQCKAVEQGKNKLLLSYYGLSKYGQDERKFDKLPITKQPSTITSNIYGNFGEDAFFIVESERFTVLGVADGVGGWTSRGIDPAVFSGTLVHNATEGTIEKLNKLGPTDTVCPLDILKYAYYTLIKRNTEAYGSSTACFAVFDNQTNELYIANLGDSGAFIRKLDNSGVITCPQQHYWNCPYQLSLPPPNYSNSSMSDKPESASIAKIKIEPGEFLIIATDGYWDNIDVSQVNYPLFFGNKGEFTQNELDEFAKNVFSECVSNSKWTEPKPRVSSAETLGPQYGGKIDDITVLVACLSK